MMDKIKTIAYNLKQLRLDQSLSQREVAYAAGISLVAYSNIEHAKTLPRDETIRRLANALGVDISEIWKKDNIKENIRFKSDSKLILKGKLLSYTEIFVNILRKLGNKQNLDFNRDLSSYKGMEPKYLAEQIRKKWGIDNLPINGLLNLLEEKGISLLSYKAMSDLFKSFSGNYEGIGPIIVFNSWEVLSVESIIFNVAHELGHLLLHSYEYDSIDSEADEKEEDEADEFASYFLMPEQSLIRIYCMYKNLNIIDRVMAIKSYFNVSWKLVIKRIEKFQHENTSIFKDFSYILKDSGINLRIHPEVKSLNRFILFKDGCKESFIPKSIIDGIESNKLTQEEVAIFYPQRDLDRALQRSKFNIPYNQWC